MNEMPVDCVNACPLIYTFTGMQILDVLARTRTLYQLSVALSLLLDTTKRYKVTMGAQVQSSLKFLSLSVFVCRSSLGAFFSIWSSS